MADIGHNHPPQPLTDKNKVARAKALLERGDLSAAQKCVAAYLVLDASKDGVAEASTPHLMAVASVSKRDTVFGATKALRDAGIIEKMSTHGKAGRYTLLPDRVVDAVVDAFVAAKTGTGKRDQFGCSTGPVEQDHLNGTSSKLVPASGTSSGDKLVPLSGTGSDKLVPLNGTGPVEQDHFSGTGTVERDQSENVPSRAYIESPSGILIPKKLSEESSPSPSQPKTNVQPVESWGTAFAAPDHEDVVLHNGRIVLLNGARSFWVGQFDGHEGDLNLALIEAAGSIQPNSKQPVKIQVERLLARKCSDRREKDRRYARAVKDRESKAAEPAKRRGGRTVTDICMEGIRDERRDEAPNRASALISIDYREV